MVSEIWKKERQEKERQILEHLVEVLNKLWKFKKEAKMVSEYQKAKALGPLATAAEFERLEARIEEHEKKLKEIEEALAYLQKDTAQPKKN